MLVAKVDDVLKPDVIKWSAFYEHRIKLGSVSAILKAVLNFILIGFCDAESHLPPRGLCC